MQLPLLWLILVLSAILSFAGTRLMRRPARPAARAALAGWTIAGPALALLACVLSLAPLLVNTAYICRDCTSGAAEPFLMGLLYLTFAAGLLLGLLRLCLLHRSLTSSLVPAPAFLQVKANVLARALGGPAPSLWLIDSDLPLACTYGLFRPRVVISTWLLENLDDQEIEAALAHELAHVAAGDHRKIWLATVLRDATFYLPGVRQARDELIRSRELLVDDAAVRVTGRPLALASALAKVWQQALRGPVVSMGAVPHLSGAGASIELRVQRLMAGGMDAQRARRQANDVTRVRPLWLLALLIVMLGLVCVLV